MSHFTSLKTTLRHKDHLLQALRSLGFEPEEGVVFARGFAGNRTAVDIRVLTKTRYDIGFRKAGGAYELVADWFGIREINPQQFVRQVTQRYAYHATRDKLEEQGFVLAAEEVHQDGRIHLVLRKTA